MGAVGFVGHAEAARGSRAGSQLAVRALAVYFAIRLLAAPAFVYAWRLQGPNRSSYPDAAPGLLTFLALSWDGAWYHLIATEGYPDALPIDPATGAPAQNAWAFYPLFPLLVRTATGFGALPYTLVAPLVALLMGAVASVLLAFLVRDAAAAAVRLRPGLPLLAVAAIAAFPSGATAMVGYSETTALTLIVASLLLLHRQRYASALVTIALLGLARGVALPMAAVVIWHAWTRLRDARRSGETISGRTGAWLAALSVVAVGSGLVWPALAGIVTGVRNAYLRTQAAWRNGLDPQPFDAFARKLSEWVGELGLPVVLAMVVVLIAISLSRPVQRLGPELQAWGGSYLIYILAVGDLGSSVLRFALLSITLPLGLVAWSKRRWVQIGMVALLLAFQLVWIVRIWVFDGVGDAFPP